MFFYYKKMALFPDKYSRICLSALLWLGWADIALAEIKPYSARYSMYRNGQLTGKVEVRLHQQGEYWVIESEVSGTHGLARILDARDNEKVVGRIRDGRFRPDSYSRHTRLTGMDDLSTVNFDWDARSVQIIRDKEEKTLELDSEALDPLSLKLEMRQRLSQQNPDMTFWLVDEDEIKEQKFRILKDEKLETSLGCLDTTPVEKVRKNSKRYTRAWHAPGLDHVAVRIEHGKTGGNHMEVRITELTLAGTAVLPRTGCAAVQVAVDAVSRNENS
jgi:hypothetical protein